MKLLATTLLAMVAARSRVGDSDIQLDAYGSIHREKIHLEELLQSWNNTMGTAPPRGWYRMRMEAVEGIDPNQIIKKSGLEGKTSVSFDFNLPNEHYCRYRKTETCCDREDQNCFTEAGCFCDEACFTTYGDCCQDHFVSCYDKLGLCLQDADDAPEAKNAASNEYKQVNKDAKKKREQKQMQNDVNGVSGTTPCSLKPMHAADNTNIMTLSTVVSLSTDTSLSSVVSHVLKKRKKKAMMPDYNHPNQLRPKSHNKVLVTKDSASRISKFASFRERESLETCATTPQFIANYPFYTKNNYQVICPVKSVQMEKRRKFEN